MSDLVAIHWFRRDLRLADNTALIEASRSHGRVLPVFILDPHLLQAADIGAPRVRYLLDCLDALREGLAKLDVPLVFRQGDPRQILPELAAEVGARAVFANRDYGPYARRRDQAVAHALEKKSIAWHDHADLLLVEPWECLTQEDRPYTVFTPFSRRWRTVEKNAPQRAPGSKAGTSRLAATTSPTRLPSALILPSNSPLPVRPMRQSDSAASHGIASAAMQAIEIPRRSRARRGFPPTSSSAPSPLDRSSPPPPITSERMPSASIPFDPLPP